MEKVSVILPVYNGAQQISNIIEIVSNFSKNYPNYNFLFVNDGSTDNSKQIILDKLRKSKNKKINLLSYRINRGKGYAIKKGVAKSEGDYICFIDSDLAYSLDHLLLLEKELENCDIVIGHRRAMHNRKKIKKIRILFGKIFNFFSRVILSLHFKDMQVGLKGFRKNIAKELFKKQTINGFAFDVEIIYLSKKKGYKIQEVLAIISSPETYNFSKVNLVRDSIKMFFCLIKIRINNFIGKYE